MDAEQAWQRAARALRFQVREFHSPGGRRTATRGAKLFTWNWSSLATSVVPPSRRGLDRAEVTSHVPLDLQK